MIQNWKAVHQLPTPISWTCGFCGRMVSGNLGYARDDQPVFRICICPCCEKPTYFEGSVQVPGVAYGNEVTHLPNDVGNLYKEARNCVSVSAFTASVLATRKLLMNVAVSQGADKNQSFQTYVSYLSTHGYVPPNATGWVDHIRNKGNEATHEIPAATEADAKDLLTFMEMILKLVFEFPNRVPGHGSPAAAGI